MGITFIKDCKHIRRHFVYAYLIEFLQLKVITRQKTL